MKKRLIAIAAVLAIAGSIQAGTIRIAGSDSMADMNRKLSEAFKASHAGVQFDISATDSTTAINTFLANKAEIASVARPMKTAELTHMPNLKAFGTGAFVEFVRSPAGQKIVAECGLFKMN